MKVITSGGYAADQELCLMEIVPNMNKTKEGTLCKRERDSALRKELQLLLLGLLLLLVTACPGNLPFTPTARDSTTSWVELLSEDGIAFELGRNVKGSWDESQATCFDRGGSLAIIDAPALVLGNSTFHKLAQRLYDETPAYTSSSPWVGVRLVDSAWTDLDDMPVDEEMWALPPVNPDGLSDRCAFLYVFPEDTLSPQYTAHGVLFGLLDGFCTDRREPLCAYNDSDLDDQARRRRWWAW